MTMSVPAWDSTAAARAIPRDPGLPALARLFDRDGPPAGVLSLAAAAGVTPRRARLHYMRHKPTENCVLLWELGTESGQPSFISGKLFADDEGARIVERKSFIRLAQSVQDANGLQGRPYDYDPQLKLLLQLFPLDVALPGLAAAMSVAETRRVDSATLGLAGPRSLSKPTILNYRPWSRCVLRYGCERKDKTPHYIAKIHRDQRGQFLFAEQRTLRGELRRLGAPWEIAAPVAYIADSRMLVFRAFDGATELRTLLSEAAASGLGEHALQDCMAEAAIGLVAFRRAVIEPLAAVTPAGIVERLVDKARGVAEIAPDLAAAIAARLRELAAEAERLRPEATVLAHGAFRHNQMLHWNGKLAVLDFDTMCMAGAGADPGDFLAGFDLTAMNSPALKPMAEQCQRAFVAALDNESNARPDWLAWYRAAAHVKWALRSISALPPGWPERTRSLLELAGATLSTIAVRADGRGNRLAQDPELPFLAMARSPDRMVEFFNRNVFDTRHPDRRATAVTTESVNYYPGRQCFLSYAIRFTNRPDETPLRATVTFTTNGEALAKAYACRYGKQRDQSGGTAPAPAVFISDYGCLVEFFPQDWKLPSLASACAPAEVMRHLRGIAIGGAHGECGVTVLRYRPHRRCVLLYSPNASAANGWGGAIGKVYEDGKTPTAGDMFRIQSAIHAEAHSKGLVVPRPLAVMDGHNILLMERVPGASMQDRLHEALDRERLARTAAAALATLHSLRFEDRTVATPLLLLRRLRAQVDQLSLVAPDLASAIGSVLYRVESLEGQCRSRELCLVHGDYQPSQILLDDDRVAIVDWDRAGLGDPAIDVGNFMAQFPKEAQMSGDPRLGALSDAFLDAYLDIAKPAEGFSERATVIQAMALVRMAVRCFRLAPASDDADGPKTLPIILSREAAACLDRLA